MADMNDYIEVFGKHFDAKHIIRSEDQNALLHVIFREIAKECQVKGLDQKVVTDKFFKEGFPVSEDWVKYSLFHPVMKQIYHVDSTTKLEMDQFTDLLDMFLLAVKMRLGIHVQAGDE